MFYFIIWFVFVDCYRFDFSIYPMYIFLVMFGLFFSFEVFVCDYLCEYLYIISDVYEYKLYASVLHILILSRHFSFSK